MKEPSITVIVGDSPRAIIAAVDTGSPRTFFSSRLVKVPPGATRDRYTIGGRTWSGWKAPVRVRLEKGCEYTVPEAFITRGRAGFNVIGTDLLQGMRCRVNLKSDRLVCPTAPGRPGCSIEMAEPHKRFEPSVARRGRQGKKSRSPAKRRR